VPEPAGLGGGQQSTAKVCGSAPNGGYAHRTPTSASP
jgi:hypothetical protein